MSFNHPERRGAPLTVQMPGKVYSQFLRCELCDYCLQQDQYGPKAQQIRHCPNVIKHPGMMPRLVPSLK